MKVGQMFPSKYLKVADLDGKPVTVTMKSVAMEDLFGDTKPVVKLQGTQKELVLNVTNANQIAELYGDDSADWGGKKITLVPATTMFQGKKTPCIRIAESIAGNSEPPIKEDPESPGFSDDDIPF